MRVGAANIFMVTQGENRVRGGSERVLRRPGHLQKGLGRRVGREQNQAEAWPVEDAFSGVRGCQEGGHEG